MTWKELKNKIESMPAEVQDEEVRCIGEYMPIKLAVLDKCDENIYFNPKWEEVYYESNIEEEELNDPYTEMMARKGEYFMFID